jgi:hypothetical protein
MLDLGAPLASVVEGSILGDKNIGSQDMLGIYAHLFLLLSLSLWLAISCHDHALLHTTNKNYILDLIGLTQKFPRLFNACRCLMGLRMLRGLFHCRRRGWTPLGRLLAMLLAPAVLLWRLVVFMFVVCPLAAVLFLWHPIRTSRIWTLLICIASVVYGICLCVHMLYLLAVPEQAPRYAVTWTASSNSGSSCECGCVYPVSATTCGRLFMIGVLAAIKCFIIGFRTLKGLRRSNWANLISVTFTIPVNAYSVAWKRPDGNPIQGRLGNEPVQSEMAFDPFALMDEQLESANSHVTLKPSFVVCREVDVESGTMTQRRTTTRELQGPNLPCDLEDIDVRSAEYVGCCGFPFLTGGIQGRFELSSPAFDGALVGESVRLHTMPHILKPLSSAKAPCSVSTPLSGQASAEDRNEAASHGSLLPIVRSLTSAKKACTIGTPLSEPALEEDCGRTTLCEPVFAVETPMVAVDMSPGWCGELTESSCQRSFSSRSAVSQDWREQSLATEAIDGSGAARLVSQGTSDWTHQDFFGDLLGGSKTGIVLGSQRAVDGTDLDSPIACSVATPVAKSPLQLTI